MTRPRLLDLFCGAGGAAAGYVRGGFDVTGVDVAPQPRYLLSGASRFVRADALEYLASHGREYDAVHASPPCQHYTAVNRTGKLAGKTYPDLVGPTREALLSIARPWVIENVIGSPLRHPLLLCGSMFGLAVRRHRLFESSVLLFQPGPCRHAEQDAAGPRFPSCFQTRKALRPGGRPHMSTVVQVYGNTAGKTLWPAAMGIDWMTSRELTQAIPPAFTFFIGCQLMAYLEAVA
jgi:DNA (cytosine-5)-methyltransferase 1